LNRIPFVKAHGAGNDFVFSWLDDIPEAIRVQALMEGAVNPDYFKEFARAICHRNMGVGADGWYLMMPARDADAEIRLFNSDGSYAELSGNGTRCAAAVLVDTGAVKAKNARESVTIRTGSGLRRLRLLGCDAGVFRFEMEIGRPEVKPDEVKFRLPLGEGAREVTIVDVGNPQCALEVESLEFDWKGVGAEIERHPHFPRRTNVSFYRALDAHTIEARFFERGAGATMSSGTGAAGAAVAAMVRRSAETPVTVMTEAGPLVVRWEREAYLTGPAEIVATGSFYWKQAGN
jgi:diaminopimelate epimerase